MPIVRFTGRHHFLSNFFVAPVLFDHRLWPTSEHAYQAAKSDDPDERREMLDKATPGEAKKFGRRVSMREDWNEIRLGVMHRVLRAKFFGNPELGLELMKTGTEELIEGNTWRDTFWGVYRGKGQNHLGSLLMRVRAELRNAHDTRIARLGRSRPFSISKDEASFLSTYLERCGASGHPDPIGFCHAGLHAIFGDDLGDAVAPFVFDRIAISVMSAEDIELMGRYAKSELRSRA